MVDDPSSDWLYDYTLQFLASPGWKIPILSFIDEKCYAFDDEDENKFEYTVIHKDMIETLLENICIEIGATHEMFYKVVKSGLKNAAHKRYFEQVLATLNFMSFKKLMVKRNKELELEALQMLQNEGHVNPEEVQQASLSRDQAELEHAIAVSIAAEEERRKQLLEEEELIRKVIEASEQEYKAQIAAEEKKIQQTLMAEHQKKESEKVARMEEEQKRKYEEQKRIEAEKKQKEEEEYKRQEESRALDKQKEESIRKKLEEEQKKLEARRIEEEKVSELRKEAKRIEEDAKKREAEKNLPPVNIKKPAVDLSEFKKLDVSSELKESEELDAINKKIAEKYSKTEEKKETGTESLAERTARLKKQREMILKKKQEERNTEMQAYLQNGGTDLSVKKELGPLAPIVSQDILDKRREILNKIKQSDI